MWKRIKKLALESLSFYPTSLEEDQEILDKDEKEKYLSYNENNCVQYRFGEKKILNFLTDSADKFLELTTMSQRDAKK